MLARKPKKTAKPALTAKPRKVDAVEVTKDLMRRYPKVIARLGE
jgi:hypothetical protein